MATIKFFTKGGKTSSTIYVRLYQGRQIDFKRSTHYQINPKHWDAKKEKLRNISGVTDKDEINGHLIGLREHINTKYNIDYANGKKINGDWLELKVNEYFGQYEETDLNILNKYCEYFISNLSTKKNHAKGGELGVSKRTIEKYENVANKLKGFQKHFKSELLITDINLKFENDFIKYLSKVEKLSDNTIGRMITFVKTICNDARDNGIKTNPQLAKIKGFKKQAQFVTLNEREIEDIIRYDFSKSPYLDNARDWLIIGLHTGQRVSDFMSFTEETIKGEYLEFTQKKTGSKTIVPLHRNVKNVLAKYEGSFPRKISEPRFNEYIKKVCEHAGITKMVEGSKINPKTKRKEEGKYAKWELVSSHICRRSFATNHYGKLPTPVLMNITNHSSEKMFLTYIGKTPNDNAKQLKEYWEAIEERNKTKKAPLKVVKSQLL